jgi:hypothetical protein
MLCHRQELYRQRHRHLAETGVVTRFFGALVPYAALPAPSCCGVGTAVVKVAVQLPDGREPVIAAKWALIWAWLSSESYIATLPIAP